MHGIMKESGYGTAIAAFFYQLQDQLTFFV
jgi:hypothetical protein